MSVGELVVMLPTLPHPAPPDEMTPRAQVYLAFGCFRHLVVGMFCILAGHQFTAAAFIPIIGYMALWKWGAMMVVTALLLGFGAIFRQRTMARTGLIASSVVTALLAAGMWLGASAIWMSGGTATPITAVLLTAFVGKDLAVCTDPMSTPLELTNLWRRVAPGGSS